MADSRTAVDAPNIWKTPVPSSFRLSRNLHAHIWWWLAVLLYPFVLLGVIAIFIIDVVVWLVTLPFGLLANPKAGHPMPGELRLDKPHLARTIRNLERNAYTEVAHLPADGAYKRTWEGPNGRRLTVHYDAAGEPTGAEFTGD